MAKKEFEWKSTSQIGAVEVSEKKRVLVQFNSLDSIEEDGEDRWFVSLITLQFFKKKGQEEAAWHITKNASFPMETMMDIMELVSDNIDYEE